MCLWLEDDTLDLQGSIVSLCWDKEIATPALGKPAGVGNINNEIRFLFSLSLTKPLYNGVCLPYLLESHLRRWQKLSKKCEG